ncbi:valine--pyruvate transaminase [Saccharophagus sp. K07]|uniref:valine--pyruvate transaminase n=1 Tax=Saccharophagus sp. K07 TaxID=2283636 RepID=UPI0016529A80|nr:valine--pyruvate transaminase [Saccharophagus sp. K07]MBC6904635.1 valine--pyruvate transaminase [Saccharophagus sp. K07]
MNLSHLGNLSHFGQLLAQDSPIVQLMEDLGEALSRNPDILFLGGGNPAQVLEAQQCFQKHLQALAADSKATSDLLGVYPAPQGADSTLQALADFFALECGWRVSPANIALVSGSQLAFFILLNLFAGQTSDGGQRQVLLPLVPEYLGYSAQGLQHDFFQARKPLLKLTQPNRFKYALDAEHLDIDATVGSMCVTRPTNPSGNLLTSAEMEKLAAAARAANIPLIVDIAYGTPFPGLVYEACENPWRPGMINVMSLSKLGLPGVRTAIVIADEPIIHWVARANTIMSLANGNLGPALLERLIRSGDLARLGHTTLPDFYRGQRDFLVDALDKALNGLPYRIHEPQGAFFVWLWFEGLPVSSQVLYENLKKLGVLVMAGEPFFFGWEKSWPHARQCLRLTYCQPEEVLAQAAQIIAAEARRLFG